jgi:phospholipase/carboxylesterase
MDRFHKSVSWNQPTESGQPESESNETDEPDDVSSAAWEAFYDPHHLDDSDSNDSGHDKFILSDNPWSHLTSHRSFFLPLHYVENYEYPLVVWLHSNGYNENQIDHVMPHISLRNYIGAGIRGTKAADSAGHRFDWHESPAAIATSHDAVIEAIDEACERFSIHESRIVLAGYGAGGTMAMRIAMRDPDRVAGAISVGGRMPQGAIRNVQQLRQRRLPMLWQWAEFNADYTAKNLQTDCRSAMAIGSQVEVRQYQGDDEMDTIVLRDIDDWIMRRIGSCSSVTTSDRWATSPTAYSNN